LNKKNPTYDLKSVRKLIEAQKLAPDLRVMQSANGLGFSSTEVYDEILELRWGNFYKSMTHNYNHKVWFDVYKKTIKNMPIYIKFRITDDGLFLLSSFKLDEDKKK